MQLGVKTHPNIAICTGSDKLRGDYNLPLEKIINNITEPKVHQPYTNGWMISNIGVGYYAVK